MKVKRGGVLLEVAAEELVPGDCVYVMPGSRIPADLRLTNTQDLLLSQAAVSGESAIVEKTAENTKEKFRDRQSTIQSGIHGNYCD